MNTAGICFCILIFLFLISAGTFCIQQQKKEQEKMHPFHRPPKRSAATPRPAIIDRAFERRINARIDSIATVLMQAINSRNKPVRHARHKRMHFTPNFSPLDNIDSLLRKHFHIMPDEPAIIFQSTK